MPENKANTRLFAGILLTVLTIIVTAGFAGAQTPAPQETITPTPEATASPKAPSSISHSVMGYSNCLKCHTEGFEKAPIMPGDHAKYTNEDCEDCHEPGVFQIAPAWETLPPGVAPSPIDHPLAEGKNSCYECHLELGDEHTVITEAWQESVHGNADIGCADCHGGDPRTDEMSVAMDAEAGYIGVPLRAVIPQVCGGCHSDVERMRSTNLPTDQYTKYFQSVHGTKLQEGDIRVAICTDCHGTHNIKKGSDPTADVYPLNVPNLCAICHSDLDLMESYNIRTDQYEQYEASFHGQLLLEEQDVRAPTCASCHGSHGAKPPTSAEVVNVCGKCHTATEDLYEESLHARIGDNAPKCWTCHGTHDVFKTDESMFIHHEAQEEQHCGTCHLDDQSFRMDKVRFERKEDRRCDTCHHEGSRIMRQILGIHTALAEASQAYQEAEESIKQAGALGMIVTEAEGKLAEARTHLVSARAAVHTTKLPIVSKLTDDALASAGVAQEMAAEKLDENLFRRLSMSVSIVIILLIMTVLVFLKRDLDRQLKIKTAGLGPAPQPEPADADILKTEADEPPGTEEADLQPGVTESEPDDDKPHGS